MLHGFASKNFRPNIRMSRVLFAGFWIIGLILGASFSLLTGESFLSMTHTAASSRGSVISLFASAFLPFLIVSLAVYFHTPVVIYCLVFGKGFCFCFVSMGIMLAFPESGWLLRWLLLFSDSLALPVLIWFCLRHIHKDSVAGAAVFFAGALIFLTATIDNLFVSSFLSDLMYY